MKRIFLISSFISAILMLSCSNNSEQQFEERTLHYKAPSFLSTRQDGKVITEQTVQGKVYVVDFFFTSCPTICPVMHDELKRVYDRFSNEEVYILSHTIDPEFDTLELLKKYAMDAGVDGNKWMFLRGNRMVTIDLANEGYYASLKPEYYGSNQDHSHSGGLFLVDRQGMIRGVYYGTVHSEVNRLMDDIDNLLTEN